MNLTIFMSHNQSYRSAIEVAYEKAKKNGEVDEITRLECEQVLSEPEPDYIYHEVDLTPRLQPDGCIYFRTLSGRDTCEQIKIDIRKRAAQNFADQMDDTWKDIKKTAVDIEPELLNELSFSIDKKGTIKPVSTSRPLDAKAEKLLFELLNNHSEFKKAAKEYVWLLAGLVGLTIDGLSAPYARHFVGAELQEG